MPQNEQINWIDFTIPNGTSVSQAIPLNGSEVAAVKIPASWNAAHDLILQGSPDDFWVEHTTPAFTRIRDQAGTALKISGIDDGQLHYLPEGVTRGPLQIKMEAVNASEVAANVSGDLTGQVGLRPVG